MGEWAGDGVRSTARELRGQPRRSVSEKKVGFMMGHKKICVFCFVLFCLALCRVCGSHGNTNRFLGHCCKCGRGPCCPVHSSPPFLLLAFD